VAENQQDRDTEDLTEEASSYRIEEARRKGQVAQSKEVAGMAALLASGVAMYVMSPQMGTQLAEFMREVFRTDLTARLNLGDSKILGETLVKALKLMGLISLPVALAGFAMGALGGFAQIGAIFSADPIQPDLTKIDPMKGLQRLFSMKVLIEGARIILKTAVVGFVAYLLIKTEVLQAPAWIGHDAIIQLPAMAKAAKGIFLSLSAILFVFAGLDYAYQRYEFMKSMRLTKQEAKQEFKEREGDPQIKARIRAVQREMARRRMMAAVKKADVIVTNPTHIAVAIVYEKDSMAAPRVVAKGADFLAQKIKKIASDAGVPLVENVPLARTLFKTVKVGQYVPRALYQAVAEVLAYVYRLKNRKF
jgi:flagellar biosynthetic protein FlhB